jgi:hypothetical protein
MPLSQSGKVMARSRIRVVGVTLLGVAVAGCATSGTPSTLRGQSGAVTWEVGDVRQTSEDRGRWLRWEYMLTLRNVGSAGITFSKVSVGAIGSAESWGGQGEQSFKRRLDAGAELHVADSYSRWCRDCDPGYAEMLFRQGITRILTYEGIDDQGRPLSVTVRIPFHPGMGTTESERRSLSGVVGQYHGVLYYYPARSPGRRYTSQDIRVILGRTGARVSGEIRTPQLSGPIQATVTGEALAGEFILDGVTCAVNGTSAGDGATVIGTFDCASGEGGSLVLNRF